MYFYSKLAGCSAASRCFAYELTRLLLPFFTNIVLSTDILSSVTSFRERICFSPTFCFSASVLFPSRLAVSCTFQPNHFDAVRHSLNLFNALLRDTRCYFCVNSGLCFFITNCEQQH